MSDGGSGLVTLGCLAVVCAFIVFVGSMITNHRRDPDNQDDTKIFAGILSAFSLLPLLLLFNEWGWLLLAIGVGVGWNTIWLVIAAFAMKKSPERAKVIWMNTIFAVIYAAPVLMFVTGAIKFHM